MKTAERLPGTWDQYRKFETNIPRKGIEGISTFVCLWAICIFPRLICLFCCRKYVDWSWEYINRSQTHECGNWDWGCTIPRKGIQKWGFHCSACCMKDTCIVYWWSLLQINDKIDKVLCWRIANFNFPCRNIIFFYSKLAWINSIRTGSNMYTELSKFWKNI